MGCDGSVGDARKIQTGGFFQIDRRVWALVCQLGLKEAVAYLVLTCGTGGDNRTTKWSINAIEKYTSISRTRAKAAVERLIKGVIIRKVVDGFFPRYTILPAHEVPGTGVKAPTPRNPMTTRQRGVFEKVERGEVFTDADRRIADTLVRNGWLTGNLNSGFHVCDDDVAKPPPPEWIWLPNALVTGAAGEVSPVELTRQTQDVMTLRLFIDLYDTQNLYENGGVHHSIIYKKYDRIKVGQRGQCTVWGFVCSGEWMSWGYGLTDCHRRKELTKDEKAAGKNPALDFFPRLGSLVTLGLVEWMPHLFESDDPDAEIIHPYGAGKTDSLEDRLGDAAHCAAIGMVTDGQYDWATNELGSSPLLAPIPHHYTNAQMIGVARLRYRPKTKAVAAWWAEHQRNCREYLIRYQELGSGISGRMAM